MDETDAEASAWARRWEVERNMRREAAEALGLDFDGYTWPTLLSLMREIAKQAKRRG